MPEFKMIDLINALNNADVMAFPQSAEADPDRKRVTISAMGEDGKRYFITRIANGVNPNDGTPTYSWARGKEMREQRKEESKKEDTK